MSMKKVFGTIVLALALGVATPVGAVQPLYSVVPRVTPSFPVQKTIMTNWSGYGVTGASFNDVTASWNVPSVDCSSGSTTYALQWIGMDGMPGPDNGNVQQVGTESDCIGGTPYYRAWYEMWGNASLNYGYQVGISGSVAPGDRVKATVQERDGSWYFYLNDVSQHWTFETLVPMPAIAPGRSSVEFVMERPLECYPLCIVSTLSIFSPITFTGIRFTPLAGNSPLTWSAISMFQNGQIVSSPGVFIRCDSSFSLTYGDTPFATSPVCLRYPRAVH